MNPFDTEGEARKAIACPTCGSPPGRRCRTLTTGRNTRNHSWRIRHFRTGVVSFPCRWKDGEPIEFMFFGRFHQRSVTCDESCVIHNRTAHHMQFWTLIWRNDRGIFERLCPEHGVGHPDPDQGPYWKLMNQDWQWIHGCCGDCVPPEKRNGDGQDVDLEDEDD